MLADYDFALHERMEGTVVRKRASGIKRMLGCLSYINVT